MNRTIRTKIIGAGPTGILLAVVLAKKGIYVDLVDINSFKELKKRRRAYAITQSSKDLLSSMQIWDEFEALSNGFSKLYVCDIEIDKKALFSSSDLIGIGRSKYVGWIIDHKNLIETLENILKNSRKIEFFQREDNNITDPNYDFIFAADGPSSNVRSLLEIKTYTKKYKQSCLTAKILLRGTSPQKAYEILHSEGPIALLPLGGDMFQLVWSATYESCLRRSKLSELDFLDELTLNLPYGLNPDILIDKRKVFPLEMNIPYKLTKGKVILIGESAHRFHPVGGQGLNLCFRDIKRIVYLVNKVQRHKLSIKKLLKLYSIYTYIDILQVAILTDSLIIFFSNKLKVFYPLRHTIMFLLNRSLFLRKILLGAMTYGPMTFLKFLSELRK